MVVNRGSHRNDPAEDPRLAHYWIGRSALGRCRVLGEPCGGNYRPGRVEGIDPSTGHESPIRSLEGRVLLSRCRGDDDLHRRRGHRIQRC